MRKQLEVLEERLEEMVQPRLLDALMTRKVYSFFLLSQYGNPGIYSRSQYAIIL